MAKTSTTDASPNTATEGGPVIEMVDGGVQINWQEAPKSSGFDPFEAGQYPANVTAAPIKIGRNSGKPYVAAEFTLTGEMEGRKVWSNFSMQPQSLWAFKEFLLKTGQYDADELERPDFVFQPQDIVGAAVILDLVQEEYKTNDGEDKVRMAVNKVLADDGSSTWGS